MKKQNQGLIIIIIGIALMLIPSTLSIISRDIGYGMDGYNGLYVEDIKIEEGIATFTLYVQSMNTYDINADDVLYVMLLDSSNGYTTSTAWTTEDLRNFEYGDYFWDYSIYNAGNNNAAKLTLYSTLEGWNCETQEKQYMFNCVSTKTALITVGEGQHFDFYAQRFTGGSKYKGLVKQSLGSEILKSSPQENEETIVPPEEGGTDPVNTPSTIIVGNPNKATTWIGLVFIVIGGFIIFKK